MRTTRRRHLLLRSKPLLTAAMATGLLLAAAVPATATGDSGSTRSAASHDRLSAKADRAGLTLAKGGRMGWSNPKSAARPMTTSAAQALTAGVTYGIDVSAYQGNVSWSTYWGQGKRFAYVKATEGNYYTNPKFTQQYNGSYNVGMIRGSYHFANPKSTTGAAQASYFVAHGGGWSKDGKTLPGALDIEYNPYSGGTCYGYSQAGMVSWIKSFTAKYKQLTGRDPVIYSTTDWWKTCTGNSSAFGSTNPLWIARYASSPGTLPAGWGFYTIWQYASSPLDLDRFNGSIDRVKALANG